MAISSGAIAGLPLSSLSGGDEIVITVSGAIILDDSLVSGAIEVDHAARGELVTDEAIVAGTIHYIDYLIAAAIVADDAVVAGSVSHLLPTDYPGQRVFRLRITKAGLSDLIVPGSNISARAGRDDRQSSLTATVPSLNQLDDIASRVAGGRMCFDAGLKTARGTTWVELLNVPLGRIPRYDDGPNNKSITLSGYGVQTIGAGKTVAVDKVQYRSYNDGKRSLRRSIDWNLCCGDTIIDNGESWTIGEIAYAMQAEPPGESMTVTEA